MATETRTEYGYLIENARGFRGAVSPIPATTTAEEAAGYVFGCLGAPHPRGSRYVLVTRTVTVTDWTNTEETP